MHTGNAKASPASNTALTNPTKLDKASLLPKKRSEDERKPFNP